MERPKPWIFLRRAFSMERVPKIEIPIEGTIPSDEAALRMWFFRWEESAVIGWQAALTSFRPCIFLAHVLQAFRTDLENFDVDATRPKGICIEWRRRPFKSVSPSAKYRTMPSWRTTSEFPMASNRRNSKASSMLRESKLPRRRSKPRIGRLSALHLNVGKPSEMFAKRVSLLRRQIDQIEPAICPSLSALCSLLLDHLRPCRNRAQSGGAVACGLFGSALFFSACSQA